MIAGTVVKLRIKGDHMLANMIGEHTASEACPYATVRETTEDIVGNRVTLDGVDHRIQAALIANDWTADSFYPCEFEVVGL